MTNEICLRNGLSYPGMDRANMSCPEEFSDLLLQDFSSGLPTSDVNDDILAGRDYLKKLGKLDHHITARNFRDKGASFSGYLNYLSNFDDPHATPGEQLARATAMPALILGALALSLGCNGVKEEPEKEIKEPSPIEKTGIVVSSEQAEVEQDAEGNYFLENRLVIGFDSEVTDSYVNSLISGYQGRITGKIPQLKSYEVEVSGELEGIIDDLSGKDKVDFVERNYLGSTDVLDYTIYSGEKEDALWGLKNIQLAEAYNFIEDNNIQLNPANVAVLDTSFDLKHRELEWQFVDPLWHYDFGDGDDDVRNINISSIKGSRHGTYVAGIIAARNNLNGTNGIAFYSKLLPLKVFTSGTFLGRTGRLLLGDTFKWAAGLSYTAEVANDLDIKVVNMSLGQYGRGPGFSTERVSFNLLERAVKRVNSKGIIMVAAAGNGDGEPECDDCDPNQPLRCPVFCEEGDDAANHYPSAFPEVISVGATKHARIHGSGTQEWVDKELRAEFSNYSADNNANILTLAAPGRSVALVGMQAEPLDVGGGTSLAAPMVSGLVALVKSIKPDMNKRDIVNLLRRTADDIETEYGTWKRINAYKAVVEVSRMSGCVPGEEVCDGIDNNCNGLIDEGNICRPDCIDNDRDGYGANCELGADCDDNNPGVHPGLEEICDGVDNNCRGGVDEGCGPSLEGKIVFVSDRDGNNEIYVMNADGSNQRRLTNNSANDSTPDWSPDGSKLAFTSDRDGNNEIYVMRSDGSEERRLTDSPTDDITPDWSPDGNKIVFISDRDEYNEIFGRNTEIYTMNLDGSNLRRLTNRRDWQDDSSPAWSPDGSEIAFTSKASSGREWQYYIFVMNADGSNQRKYDYRDSWSPAWSPDGSEITFVSRTGGSVRYYEIYVMKADGSNLRRLTNNHTDNSPVWSPDGGRIAFTRGGDIYIMNADGSNQINITNNPASDSDPDWK